MPPRACARRRTAGAIRFGVDRADREGTQLVAQHPTSTLAELVAGHDGERHVALRADWTL